MAYNYGADEQNPELRALNAEVNDDPDSFEAWEKLVHAAEGLEGGLNRNSSSQSITSARNVYDRFLAKFPLFFGYWKKYADLEFSIAGTEAAELVYERGVASINSSVDLWAQYCGFKLETCHEPDVIRELFERGAESVGLDFLSHPFWDKYLEFEERMEQYDKMFAVLGRIIYIPMHQYARYFERFRQLGQSRLLSELCPAETLAQYRAEHEMEHANNPKSEPEVDRDLRARIDNYHLTLFHRCQTETNKRWTYEQEIKRPYFHVTELDDAQLVNWRKYLDFEEGEGNYKRICFLYERCLVAAAYYDELWLRYARWMSAQTNKSEEVRHILQRAACIFAPIARPQARLQFALFEEMNGRIEVAYAIYESMLMTLPGHIETITAWCNAARRHGGIDAAVGVYQSQISSDLCDLNTKATLIGELASVLWRMKGSVDEARAAFTSNVDSYVGSETFWLQYMSFEASLPTMISDESTKLSRLRQVYEEIQRRSQMSPEAAKRLSQAYMVHLLGTGMKDAAKEFLTFDREAYGTASTQHTGKFL